MPTLNMLYRRAYEINDKVSVIIPTVREILKDEDGYYNLVNILTSTPVDLMVELDDAGIDFTTITDYELFILMFRGMASKDTSLIFGDLDLSKFELKQSERNGTVILYDKENDIVIDRAIYGQIAAALRKIHHLERNRRKPANQEAKEYMLKRAREKAARNKKRSKDSQVESLIIAMVNTDHFKYDFNSVLDLSIYQFNESVKQIIKKVEYDHRMGGVYAGTIDTKKLSQDDLNWLIHK